MNIVVSEDDFLKIQNDKLKESYSKRVFSANKDVRVEARVEKLEVKMDDVTSEIKMLNKTMRDVADTLREIKDDQKRIQAFEIQKAMLERDIQDNKNLVGVVFKKVDALTDIVQKMKEVDAGNNVKIGSGEKLFWIIAAGIIGAIGWFK